MARRVMLLLAALTLTLPMVGQHPSEMADAADKDKGGNRFIHVFLFQIKQKGQQAEIKALIKDANELLATIPSVRQFRVGKPSDVGTPGVEGGDYHVGLLVMFDDENAFKTYLKHPQRKKFIKIHAKNYERVLAFDFIQKSK